MKWAAGNINVPDYDDSDGAAYAREEHRLAQERLEQSRYPVLPYNGFSDETYGMAQSFEVAEWHEAKAFIQGRKEEAKRVNVYRDENPEFLEIMIFRNGNAYRVMVPFANLLEGVKWPEPDTINVGDGLGTQQEQDVIQTEQQKPTFDAWLSGYRHVPFRQELIPKRDPDDGDDDQALDMMRMQQ